MEVQDDSDGVTTSDQTPRISVKVVMKTNEDQKEGAFESNDDLIGITGHDQKIALIKSPTSPIEEDAMRLNLKQTEAVMKPTDSTNDNEDSLQNKESFEGMIKGKCTDIPVEESTRDDSKKDLNSITMNLFQAPEKSNECQPNNLSDDGKALSSASMSESTFAESLRGDDGDVNENGDVHEEKDQEQYEAATYLPRHDVFLPRNKRGPQSQKGDNAREFDGSDKHQILLFGNLDRTFEKNTSMSVEEISICSAQEFKDITKMCFAAMAVVFSSHNPSVTTIANSGCRNPPGTYSGHDIFGIQDVIVPNEIDYNENTKASSVLDSPLRATHTLTENMCDSVAISSSVSCISEENNTFSMNSKEDPSVADSLLNEECKTNALVDNMDQIQRPSVPFIVVHMLWKQLIKYRLFDRKKEDLQKQIDVIINKVQFSLVTELGFLEAVNYTSASRISSKTSFKEMTKEDETVSTMSTYNVECLQINHEIHLQYGRYVSKDCSRYFPFYLANHLKKSVHSLRIYDEETWNPEEALNATMSKTCVKFLKKYRSKQSDDSNVGSAAQSDILKFEYAVEMLPWHLMRAMLHYDVVDLLTDYSFVHDRMEVLDLNSAVQMHIADAEELHNCIIKFMTVNPNAKIDFEIERVLVQSYGLLGGIIHSENTSIPLDDGEKVQESEVEKIDNQDAIDFYTALAMSKAFQALGDSLSRCNMRTEAMKFYHRALDKFESIDAGLCFKEDDLKSSDTISRSQSHLLMGGILSRIAFIYESQKNNTDAMLCYERALSYYSRHKTNQHFKGIAKVLASMGQLHHLMKEYNPAYTCLRESLKLFKSFENKNVEEIANLTLLLGHVQKNKGKLNEALVLLSEAMYDKINVFGKHHPEVGFLHQTIGVVYCDKGDFQKGLSHFDDALRIRESALQSVLKHFGHNETNARIQAREIEVAESLQCIGKVYEHFGDMGESFSFLVGNVSIYRSHFLAVVSNQASIMVSDVGNFLDGVSGESVELSNLYRQLIQAIQVGKQLYSIDAEKLTVEKQQNDIERLLEVESQMAEILYDLGLIEAAQFMYRVTKFDNGTSNLNESLRYDAKSHFEQSIKIRKKMIERLNDLETIDDVDHQQIDYENITVAVISYELGKLFCGQETAEENELRRRRASMVNSAKQNDSNHYSRAVMYFQDARIILEDSIEMAETLDYINNEDDCWISRLHKTPEIFEDILHTLAVLYRKLEKYDKSVECYNSVSLLLTRNELDDENLQANPKDSKLSLERMKVAQASQSIGDILFDTGEYSRALKSYEEALQLLRAQCSDDLIVAETLCLRGNTLVKLKFFENAIISYDEAFRIRVAKLPKDHKDIATCFHMIGNAYEGDGKLYQALEYYKKAHRILSKHLVDTDTGAADVFYDLGNIVLMQNASSKWSNPGGEPSEDEISLSFSCFELCRDIYRRNFGDDALELGNSLNSLGVIHMKYEEYTKAIHSFETALKIFHGAPLGQSLKIARSLNLLALALVESGSEDYEIILEYYNLSKETYEEEGMCNTEHYAELNFNIGEVSLKIGTFLLSIFRNFITKRCILTFFLCR